MKTILLMRHAEVREENYNLHDFEHPLSLKGLENAQFMGNILYKNSMRPDLIISSTAKRAKQTAILLQSSAEIENPIDFLDNMYEASPLTLLNIALNIKDKNDSVLLIGHNPGVEGFIEFLTTKKLSMTSTSIAEVKLNIETWKDLSANCGSLETILHPEDLSEKANSLELSHSF
jgi:phosphohistidine phosphatase